MIPKFSIRQLLWLMVAIGLFSLCMSSAARGNRVSFGISVAVIGSILPLTAYAVVHWASFAIASITRLMVDPSGGNTVEKEPVVAASLASDTVVPLETVREEPVASDGGENV